jgi:hypothetical protein
MKNLYLALVAITLFTSEAFVAPGLASRHLHSHAFHIMAASDKPLTELCEITKEACDAVAPMLNRKCKIDTGFAVRCNLQLARKINVPN